MASFLTNHASFVIRSKAPAPAGWTRPRAGIHQPPPPLVDPDLRCSFCGTPVGPDNPVWADYFRQEMTLCYMACHRPAPAPLPVPGQTYCPYHHPPHNQPARSDNPADDLELRHYPETDAWPANTPYNPDPLPDNGQPCVYPDCLTDCLRCRHENPDAPPDSCQYHPETQSHQEKQQAARLYNRPALLANAETQNAISRDILHGPQRQNVTPQQGRILRVNLGALGYVNLQRVSAPFCRIFIPEQQLSSLAEHLDGTADPVNRFSSAQLSEIYSQKIGISGMQRRSVSAGIHQKLNQPATPSSGKTTQPITTGFASG